MDIEGLISISEEKKAELFKIAAGCKNIEEFINLKKESGIELSFEYAEKIFRQAQQNNVVLSDDELDKVSGGEDAEMVPCPSNCGTMFSNMASCCPTCQCTGTCHICNRPLFVKDHGVCPTCKVRSQNSR